jgi:ubiquinone/menaquinone biosynthesis C-methylase UbiE
MTSAATNAVQAEHWNGPEGHHWAAHHERYGAMLAPFGDRVLDAAAVGPGERVLDVGCGAGDLALAAGRSVGPEGHVVGVDLSVPLTEAASRRAAEAGLGNLSFVVGGAQSYACGAGAFDVAVSRFGVMFFDDPSAAFTNIGHRCGRVGV